MSQKQANVAVIGAGPCGLAVARELLKAGHNITIFEAGDGVGGAWRFDEAATDSDLLGLDGNRFRVHSSMYPGLRTNLPRHIMGLCDFPFSSEALGDRARDPRTYPLHSEVLAFCEALADAAQLRQHLMLQTKVLRIDPMPQHSTADCDQASPACCTEHNQPLSQQVGLQWLVLTETQRNTNKAAPAASLQGDAMALEQQQQQQQQQQQGPGERTQQEWMFDAVASCVGIFSEISLPQIPGMSQWPGLQLHAHNFRGPAQFKGQKVMVAGASFSGEEIARHIAREAREVLHCARTFTGPGTAREHTHIPIPSQRSQPCNTNNSSLEPGQQQQQQQQQQQRPQQGPIPPAPEPRPNIIRHPMLHELRPDGSAVLHGGEVVQGLDAVVYCTGYKYSLPWMQHLGLLQTDSACVRPLFKHMFIPSVGPSLAICGLPWRCAKFPQFQLQGQLLARLLSGAVTLPSQQEMEQDQQQLFAAMWGQGIPLRYTHCMASFMPQDEWAYADDLACLAAGGTASVAHGTQQPSQQQQVSLSAQQQLVGCKGVNGEACTKQPNRQRSHQHAGGKQQQQQQEQQAVVSIPTWLSDLAKEVCADILARPDTFRDAWSEEVSQLLEVADQAMHAQLEAL